MKRIDLVALEADAKAQWARDAGLRAEFLQDYSVYFAYRRAEARAGARRTTGRVTTPSPNRQAAVAEAATARAPARTDGDQADRDARQAWGTDPKIRAEFLSAEDYAAFVKAERAGRFKVLGAPRQRQAPTVVAGPSPAAMRPAITSSIEASSPPATNKEKIRNAALSRFMLTNPETTAALIAEDRNPSAPAPAGKLDGMTTLADFKNGYPEIVAAVVEADRKTRE